MFNVSSDRQPRRDRRTDHPHAARLGIRTVGDVHRRPTPTRRTCARPTSPSAVGELPRHRRRRRGRPRGRRGRDPPRLRLPLRERRLRPRRAPTTASCLVGPSAEVIDAMGDKIRAKQTVAAAGVPVVPGRDEPWTQRRDARRAALDIGLSGRRAGQAGGRRRRQGHAHGPRPSTSSPRRSRRPGARPAARSATTRCWSRSTSSPDATSRCRCSPTPTGTSSTSSNATAQPAAPPPEDARGGPGADCSAADGAQTRAAIGAAPSPPREPSATSTPARSSSLLRRPHR